MDVTKQLLETHIRQRQMALWQDIIRHYDVDDTLKTQITKWIREGRFQTQACSIRGPK
jgi:hypothetical protein